MKFIIWNQGLGRPECPYMHRFMINFYFFSIRLHVWHRSDDKRYMHDHSVNFLTMVLKGNYTDVSRKFIHWGEPIPASFTHCDEMPAGSIRYRRAEHLHYVHVKQDPTITLGIYGRHRRNWGFWVKNEKHPKGRWFRPLRFFSRYGHPPCEEE